ncbi:hypothetical protein [Endozoicomonas sp. SCSIO W0465]|uniref:hypothetical protein n=1 Tax=Endozoicomonas sp. SCSIO W0465 TaxID=2918516 RepID=UPI0020764947|nr:hypothetical protein [Endozoicomonas sp. SCSIO W0465]USE37120.1 hypothetical protein MJO57_02495 [Endozoicomonas sp. SCSIO W0465]
MTEALLEALIKFEKAPMTAEMKVFFKGFEERRDGYNRALYNDDSLIEDPAFKEMLELMKNKNTMIRGLKKYSSEIEQAIADSNYYRVGQLTFSVNVLHHKVMTTPDDYVSNNPYLDLLIRIRKLEVKQLNDLKSLTDKAAASVPLNEFFTEWFVQDALNLAFNDFSIKGFCAGGLFATAIAGRYGMFTNSIVSLANALLYGFDYSRFPLQVRMVLQDALFYGVPIPYNHVDSMGLDEGIIYIDEIIKKAAQVAEKLQELSKNIQYGYNSISNLIDKMLAQIPIDSLGTELVQFVVFPVVNHVCYFAFSKSNNLFRLIVQDHYTGVTTVTGTTLEQLKTAIINALEPFAQTFNIPLNSGPDTALLPGRGFGQLTDSLLDPLESMELIKDSALTVKDIMTHTPSQLKELDQERTRAMTKKYLETVSEDANRKLLKINLKSLSESESKDLAKFAQLPMVMLMREVLTALELDPNPAQFFGDSKFTDLQLMNAHVITTLNNIAEHQASHPKKTADTDAQSAPQGAD